jgi:hypothetical protein
MEKHPDQFSFVCYIFYILWLLLISLKYIYKPVTFSKIIKDYFLGLADSLRNKYYRQGNPLSFMN